MCLPTDSYNILLMKKISYKKNIKWKSVELVLLDKINESLI